MLSSGAARRVFQSIRFRVIATAVVVFGLGAFLLGYAIVAVTSTRTEQEISAPLRQVADKVCSALVEKEPLPETQGFLDAMVYYQVLNAQESLTGYLTPTENREPTEAVPASCKTPATFASVQSFADLEDERQLLVERVIEVENEPQRVLVVAALRLENDALARLSTLLRVGFPLLVVLVGALLWLVTTRALRPVDLLRSEAEEISENTLDRRLPESDHDDEISRLAASLNKMLDRLDRSHERQRQFVSDASHELRSPAATLVAIGELLGSEPDRLQELLPNVNAEAARLASLVDALIELARLGEIKDKTREKVAVHLVLRDDAERLLPRADLQGISIDTTGVKEVFVAATKPALVGVIRNLTDNALRHAKTEVSLSCFSEKGRVYLEVGDDGEGIPASERETIFERFSRLDTGRERNAGGTGIGLALVKDLVVAYDGKISVKESSKGGALFQVCFPETRNE